MHTNRPKEPIKVIRGHKFYALDKADTILHARYLMAEIENMYLQQGISSGYLREITNLLIDRAFNTTDINKLKTDIIAIAENINNRVGMLSEMKYYEKLATILFLMDDEPHEYNEEYQAQKIKVWSEKKEDRIFFCLEAYKYFNTLANISTTDIIDAWMALNERIEQLPNIKI